MDKIGNILKQKRLELGLTIEQISEKTRLTTKHIKAIEEGDISYFKDDLSYLRFFLKSYCDALGLDFDEMKEELRLSIDDYTTSFTTKAVAQHEAIERGVRENAEKLRQPSEKKKKPKKQHKRPKIDMSLVSFLAIVIVIIIALIFAFVMFIQNSRSTDDGENNTMPPVAEVYTQDPQPDTPKEPETPKDPEKKEMVITRVSDTEYTLENLQDNEDIDIELSMGSNTSFRALVDDKQLADPVQKIYDYKSVIHVREKAVKGKKITLAFGFMKNNTIKINGKSVELPASIVNKEGSAVIQLTVKGE